MQETSLEEVPVVAEKKKVKHPGPSRAGESEEERMAKSPICLNCKKDRLQLYLLPHRKTTLRVCTNTECYKYCNLAALKSWKP